MNLSAPAPKGLPTVHAMVSDMFETSNPLHASQLKEELVRIHAWIEDRDTDIKVIGKIKAQATYPLDFKFGLPYYYVSGKYGEDEDKGTSNSNTNSAMMLLFLFLIAML